MGWTDGDIGGQIGTSRDTAAGVRALELASFRTGRRGKIGGGKLVFLTQGAGRRNLSHMIDGGGCVGAAWRRARGAGGLLGVAALVGRVGHPPVLPISFHWLVRGYYDGRAAEFG